MTVGPSGTQWGVWRLLMMAPGGSCPPASRGRDTGRGRSAGLRPWAHVEQDVPEAGHGPRTRSRWRPTVTGDGQGTLLARRVPHLRIPIPAVRAAAGRGGAVLARAWRSGRSQDSPHRDVPWTRAPFTALGSIRGGSFNAARFQTQRGGMGTTRSSGADAPAPGAPPGDWAAPAPHPSLSCAADRGRRFSAVSASARRRATADSEGLTLLPTAGVSGGELAKRLRRDQLSRTPRSGHHR